MSCKNQQFSVNNIFSQLHVVIYNRTKFAKDISSLILVVWLKRISKRMVISKLYKKFNFNALLINKELDDIRQKILLEKNLKGSNEPKEITGIENFWIISKSGVAIFSLKNSLFISKNDQNLFAGFISAIASLSQHLSKSNLTEIKIEKISLHVQTYESFFIVSLISSNHELSLKYLSKFVELYGDQITTYVNSIKKDSILDLKKDFYNLTNNLKIKKEIIFGISNDYVSQFIFGIIALDELFKKMHLLIDLVSIEVKKELVNYLVQYINKIANVNVNIEIISQLKHIVEAFGFFTEYLERSTLENYNNYIKTLFIVFVQFFNGIHREGEFFN